MNNANNLQYYIELFIYYTTCIGLIWNIYALLILINLKMYFLTKLMILIHKPNLNIQIQQYTLQFIINTAFNDFNIANNIIMDLIYKHDTFDEFAIPIIKEILNITF